MKTMLRYLTALLLLAPLSACAAGKKTGSATVLPRFDDVDHWVELWETPKRHEWQKPRTVLRVLGVRPFRALTHQGESHGIFLSAFETPRGRWIGLVVYGQDTSLGLVQLFFDRMVDELTQGVPAEGGTKQVLAQDFESELHSSLRALFGR